MKTQSEAYEVMDMIKPYLQRITKDLGDLGLGVAINCEGGRAILTEQEKNVVHEHIFELDSDMVASGWHVDHQFSEEEIDEYHAEIDRNFNKMMGADEWGSFVGVIQ